MMKGFPTTPTAAPPAPVPNAILVGEYSISGQQQLQWRTAFNTTDSDRDETLSTAEARFLLQKSGLAAALIEQILQLADVDSTGLFTWPKFALAMTLAVHQLSGKPVPSLRVPAFAQLLQAFSPAAAAPSPAGPHGFSWAISPAALSKYYATFAQVDADADGIVTPTEARELFMKSGLPAEDLQKIWALSFRTPGAPGLNAPDFVLAMFLINARLTVRIELPQAIPKECADSLLALNAQLAQPAAPSGSLAPPPLPAGGSMPNLQSPMSALPLPSSAGPLSNLTQAPLPSGGSMPNLPLPSPGAGALPHLPPGHHAAAHAGNYAAEEAALTSRSEKLDQDMQSLNSQISSASGLLDDQKSALAQLQALCDEKAKLKESLLQSWERIQKETLSLGEQLLAEEARIDSFSKEMTQIDADIRAAQESENSARESLEKAQAKTHDQQQQKSKIVAEQKAKTQSLTTMRSQTNELLSKEKKLLRSIAKLSSKTAKIDSDLASVEIERAGVQERISILNGRLESETAKQKSLEAQLALKQSETSAIKAQSAALEQQLSEKQERNQSLLAQQASHIPAPQSPAPQPPLASSPPSSRNAALASSPPPSRNAPLSPTLGRAFNPLSPSPPKPLPQATTKAASPSANAPTATPVEKDSRATTQRQHPPLGTGSDDPFSFAIVDPFSLYSLSSPIVENFKLKTSFRAVTPEDPPSSSATSFQFPESFATPFDSTSFGETFDFSSSSASFDFFPSETPTAAFQSPMTFTGDLS